MTAEKTSSARAAGVRHRWLYALPESRLPQRVRCADVDYELTETFKHDFFAATGLYQNADGRPAVLKVGRQTSLFGIPLAWIGRFLCRRESTIYRLVEDLPGVPRLIGVVGDTGLMHDYVPGRPLERRDVVSDVFFDQLSELIAELHARDVAYVDLNKRQNVLLGEDGRPYLIDFQISLYMPRRGWRRLPPARWLLRRFQRADLYHVLKHKRRLRPDLLTDEERQLVENVGFWIRLHRFVARPLIQLRRMLKRRLQRGESTEVAGSSAK